MDYEKDTFEDILAFDKRYAAKAYTTVMEAVEAPCDPMAGEEDESARDLLYRWTDIVLDEFGPLSHRVLAEWGVKTTLDFGNMLANLAKTGRYKPRYKFSLDDLDSVFSFEDEFLGPFAVK